MFEADDQMPMDLDYLQLYYLDLYPTQFHLVLLDCLVFEVDHWSFCIDFEQSGL